MLTQSPYIIAIITQLARPTPKPENKKHEKRKERKAITESPERGLKMEEKVTRRLKR